MATEMDPETVDRDDEIKWNMLQSDLGVPEQDEVPAPEETSESFKLPVEPASSPEADDRSKAVAFRNEISTFFLYGHRDGAGGGPIPVPALLHQHRDLSRVRHEYPICLISRGEGAPGRTLAKVFNDLVESDGDDGGDSDRRFSQHALRLEFAIRALATGVKTPGRLSDLCSKAGQRLLDETRLSKEREAKLREDIEKVKEALPFDGDVICCSTDAPSRLFDASMNAFWSERAAEYLPGLDELIRETQDILDSADSRSANAHSAEQLADATAEEDGLDYTAMSQILGESGLVAPLPEDRRKRIEDALDTMRRVRPLYALAGGKDSRGDLPFSLDKVVNDCPAAAEEHSRRMAVMTGFFRSVRIARLEIENKYHPVSHDPFFAHFDPSELTESERSYCPPVLIYLDSAFVKKARKIELLNLLAAGTPVKVLVQLGDLCHNEKDGTASPIPSWTSQIASMVSAMGNVYVSQMTASRPSSIQASMMDGLVYNGPALFSVYCPDSSGEQPLGTYLLAAAAEEARAFPAFTYNPGLGETLADRVNVLQNPQNNRIWPVDKFDYQTETEEQRQLELAFTPADFLLADPRFKDMFWNVSPEYWTEELIALQDYLQLPDEKEDDTPDHIPYVTAVDSDGKVARMVPTRRVLVAVERAAQAWRGLQEMGGIDNSHALALIAEEKQNLEEAMKSEVEAIETKYSAELERDLGDLSQEIIRRIAAQLIAQGQSVPSFAAFPPVTSAGPKPAAPPETAGETAAPAEEKVEEEEEEEAVSFDEPYIDTPLCTSCNDCMKVNAQVFLYNENKQAYLGDLSKATYEQLVRAAEKCPVHIIHPGKPKDPNEPNLDELVARAAKFN